MPYTLEEYRNSDSNEDRGCKSHYPFSGLPISIPTGCECSHEDYKNDQSIRCLKRDHIFVNFDDPLGIGALNMPRPLTSTVSIMEVNS